MVKCSSKLALKRIDPGHKTYGVDGPDIGAH